MEKLYYYIEKVNSDTEAANYYTEIGNYHIEMLFFCMEILCFHTEIGKCDTATCCFCIVRMCLLSFPLYHSFILNNTKVPQQQAGT